MLYHIFYPLSEYFSPLNVVRYITFRAGCAFMTSFFISMIFGKFFLKKLQQLQFLEKVNMYGHAHLESLHEGKKGTPTMGGLLIIFSLLATILLWARLDNYFIWLSLLVIVSLGYLGFKDDSLKIRSGKGLSRKDKLFCQILVGVVIGFLMVMNKNISTTWDFPFFKRIVVDLGYFYIFWAALIIVATSNAVNFTDGLDGLAIGALIINALIFALFSYLAGHIRFANYLFIPYIENAGELSVICFALAGAGLGFLWFNSYPAQIFMGDVGALSLGGILGAIALFVKKEFLLFISGGLFVMEALSVIVQIFSVKVSKKRVFRAAPLHHHLQLLGWKEPKVIVRLWIVSIICAVFALITLKLR